MGTGRPLRDDGLGSEDMLDLGGTDTEGKSSECSMGGSVRVSADNSCAWKSEALLRSNNVDDTLALACFGY